MPITLNTTATDHIPEEFTIEGLTAAGFTEQEIEAMKTGDDPIVAEKSAEPDPNPAPPAAEIGTPPAPAQQQAAPPAAAQPDPVIPQIPDTAEAEATIARVNEALEKLADDYDSGDLTKAEFLEQQRALVQEQAKAQVFIESAQSAIQEATQTAQQHWFARLDAYKAVAPELWSETHLQGWDAHLRLVTGNAAYADMTRDQQIKIAHTLYAAAYEARTGQKIAGPKPDAKVNEPLEVREDPRPDPITTLAGFNSDTTAEVEDSRFAAVDRIKDPLAMEAALMGMTDEQRERYLLEV